MGRRSAVGTRGLAGAGKDTYALKEETPTLEDLIVSPLMTWATIAHNEVYKVLVAPYPLKVLSLSLVSSSNAVATDEDNYWRVLLGKYSGGVSGGTVAEKTTKTTGGEAWDPNVDWNFDAVTWTEANNEFAKGDLVVVRTILVGTSPGLPSRVSATLRYQPL